MSWLQSEKLELFHITLVTASRRIWGDPYKQDWTQGSERQEDEASHLLWESRSQSSLRKRSHDQGTGHKGKPWWQFGSSLGPHRKEVTSPTTPPSPFSSPHVPSLSLHQNSLPSFLLTLPRKRGSFNVSVLANTIHHRWSLLSCIALLHPPSVRPPSIIKYLCSSAVGWVSVHFQASSHWSLKHLLQEPVREHVTFREQDTSPSWEGASSRSARFASALTLRRGIALRSSDISCVYTGWTNFVKKDTLTHIDYRKPPKCQWLSDMAEYRWPLFCIHFSICQSHREYITLVTRENKVFCPTIHLHNLQKQQASHGESKPLQYDNIKEKKKTWLRVRIFQCRYHSYSLYWSSYNKK